MAKGVMMTPEADTATWRGAGVDRFGQRGTVAYRGVIYLETVSPRLSRVNGACAVYEFEADEGGKTQTKSWEWK